MIKQKDIEERAEMFKKNMVKAAEEYAEEANDRLQEYGMMHKKLKMKTTNLMQSFDAYDKLMRAILDPNSPANVNHQDGNKIFCEQFEAVRKAMDEILEQE